MEPSTQKFHSLDLLPRGCRALLVAIEPVREFGLQDAQVGLRLKELGFVPGVELEVIGHGFFGADPIAVKIGDTKFALRRPEAQKLLVKPL